MRWVSWPVFLGALCVFAIPVALAGFGNPDPCDYSPTCTTWNYGDCGECERAMYDTACYGGCNLSSWSDCDYYGLCPVGNTRTTGSGCPSGHIKNQECTATACDWEDTSGCYLDPSGDYDGDGVSNSQDDCAFVYAPPPTHCNGCPNPTCAGCLTWPAACPASGGRLCTEGDDSQCTGYQCVDGCVGNNRCSFDGDPYCDASTGNCACPSQTCTYDPLCDLDDDNDGVPDVSDQCPNTPIGEPVDFDGCSCSQLTCDDLKECTADSCETAQCVFTNLPVGTVCNSGVCDGQGTCSAVTWCAATPGCMATHPAGSHVVTGDCTNPEETCYACNPDTTWNGNECVSDACSPLCSPSGTTRCTDQVLQTCQSNGCWQDTATCSGTTPVCTTSGCVACVGPNDCGGSVCCNNVCCGTDETCQSGTCTSSCTPSQEVCNGVDDDCDTLVDAVDSSMTACSGGRSCSGGSCVCPSGYWDGSACVACTAAGHCAAQVCQVASCPTYSCVYADAVDNTECTITNMNDGHCVAGNCVADCVVTTEICNGVDDDCDGVADPIDPDACAVGTCTALGVWTCVECDAATDCTTPDRPYCVNRVCSALIITPSSVDMLEGASLTMDIVFNPAGTYKVTIDHDLRETSFTYPAFWVRANRADIGSHRVTFTVETLTPPAEIGEVDMTLTVRCNPENECCDVGKIYYNTNGERCQLAEDAYGICDKDGDCVENCIRTNELACDGYELWYLDTCGNLAELIKDCALEGKECTTQPAPPACRTPSVQCSGEYRYFCQDDNVYREDMACHTTALHDDCDARHTCIEDNDKASCVRRSQCTDEPGTIWCDQCIDPLTDWGNCGGCGRQCDADQQCIEGMCEDIVGCVVICNDNDLCGENELCINPGSCTKSECQPINVLEQNDTAILELSELLQEGLVQVNTSISGNHYRYTVTNLAGTPLHNVSITTEFKKLVASSAEYLHVQGVDYTIIEDDPVLAFRIPSLDDPVEFTVATGKTLTEDDLGLATILSISYMDLLGLWNNTKEALTMGLNTEFDGENTKIHLTLNPNRNLDGGSVPIEIPKCMAKYASEMQLGGNYRVIKEDPLIVWQFDQLNKPTEIAFSVPGDIDEECKAQLKAMALANHVGKPINPWLAFLLPALLPFILIYFQRFKPGMRETIPKDEYFAIGRQQGRSEEELKREWRDYKRRF